MPSTDGQLQWIGLGAAAQLAAPHGAAEDTFLFVRAIGVESSDSTPTEQHKAHSTRAIGLRCRDSCTRKTCWQIRHAVDERMIRGIGARKPGRRGWLRRPALRQAVLAGDLEDRQPTGLGGQIHLS
jgi:hypothetical protein